MHEITADKDLVAFCGLYCAEFPEARECGTFNNFMARIFGFIFRSDRAACIAAVREKGCDSFAREMAARRARIMRR